MQQEFSFCVQQWRKIEIIKKDEKNSALSSESWIYEKWERRKGYSRDSGSLGKEEDEWMNGLFWIWGTNEIGNQVKRDYRVDRASELWKSWWIDWYWKKEENIEKEGIWKEWV